MFSRALTVAFLPFCVGFVIAFAGAQSVYCVFRDQERRINSIRRMGDDAR